MLSNKSKNKSKNKQKSYKKDILLNKIFFNIKNNVVRQINNYLGKFINFKKMKGLTYYYVHIFLMVIISFITFFTTSISDLIIVLIIVSLDAISVIFLHECPLTTMEKKYLGYTSCDERNDFLRKANIVYNCNHTYEKQIELLINIWCIIVVKCLSIVFLNLFNFKLVDTNNIYA